MPRHAIRCRNAGRGLAVAFTFQPQESFTMSTVTDYLQSMERDVINPDMWTQEQATVLGQ